MQPNGLLPLQGGPRTTYTQLAHACKAVYAVRGPELVRSVVRTLAWMEDVSDEDWAVALSELNDLSVELGAMHEGWADFSLVCFMEFMDATRRSPETRLLALRSSFNATVSKLSLAQLD